jgi:uncharacterized membrane protein
MQTSRAATASATGSPLAAERFASIDVVRGLAVLGMIHIHVVHAFASPEARDGWYYDFTNFVGGGAAPMFLALAGLSAGLAWSRGAPAARFVERGLQIWVLGLLFRLQEWVLGGRGVPIADLMRVDILNCIGVSLALMGAALRIAERRLRPPGGAARAALGLALAAVPVIACAPLVAAAAWPAALPPALAFYFAGPREFAMFPLFGWTGALFAGGALGAWAGAAATAAATKRRLVAACAAALALHPFFLAARLAFDLDTQDSSPVFLCERLALSFGLVALVEVVLGWRGGRLAATRLAAPVARWLLLLGRHSLVVYWVHVELVYGHLSHWLHDRLGPWAMTAASLLTIALMTLLAARADSAAGALRRRWSALLPIITGRGRASGRFASPAESRSSPGGTTSGFAPAPTSGDPDSPPRSPPMPSRRRRAPPAPAP